jgi:hypothetical protein
MVKLLIRPRIFYGSLHGKTARDSAMMLDFFQFSQQHIGRFFGGRLRCNTPNKKNLFLCVFMVSWYDEIWTPITNWIQILLKLKIYSFIELKWNVSLAKLQINRPISRVAKSYFTTKISFWGCKILEGKKLR